MKFRTLAILSGLIFAVGCSSNRTYTISVKNESPNDVTLWLTKNGNPVEEGWLGPEELVILSQKKDLPANFQVLQAGKSARTTVTGRFDGGVNAVLRVYRGKFPLNDILAIGVDSPARSDLTLKPGENTVLIDAAGRALIR